MKQVKIDFESQQELNLSQITKKISDEQNESSQALAQAV